MNESELSIMQSNRFWVSIRCIPSVFLFISMLVPAETNITNDSGLLMWIYGLLYALIGLGLHYVLLPAGSALLIYNKNIAAICCAVVALFPILYWIREEVPAPNPRRVLHLALLSLSLASIVIIGYVAELKREKKFDGS